MNEPPTLRQRIPYWGLLLVLVVFWTVLVWGALAALAVVPSEPTVTSTSVSTHEKFTKYKHDPLFAALRFHRTVEKQVKREEAEEAARAAAALSATRSTARTLDSGLNWSALRQCESSGNYATNTGNGYYGAYQFDLSTWASYGPPGNPALASPAEQDRRAQALYNARGASPWPTCGRLL